MKPRDFCGFIPYRLEIKAFPEFYHFPLNVLFVGFTIKDGRKISGSALYEPEFHTYRKENDLSLMRYRNVYGGDCYLILAYDEKNKQYIGRKYINGKLVSHTDGIDNWDLFFTHLTMLGLVTGERCIFEEIN